MAKSKVVSLSLVMLLLCACASGAEFQNMAYKEATGLTFDEALKQNVVVSSVDGGKGTNPLWTSEISSEAFREALALSLSSQGLLSEDGPYSLRVTLAEVDQPFLGTSYEVTTYVRYVLMDTPANRVVFEEMIVAPYTATLGDALVGTKRLRLANEGSARSNIEAFLEKLSLLKMSAGGDVIS